MHDSKVALVLSAHGFAQHPETHRFPVFIGKLQTQRGDLEVKLELRSPYKHPKLFLTQSGRADLGRPVYPHTQTSGFVCVFEEAMHDADPYKRAGYLKAFFLHATELLSMTSEDRIEEELSKDIANHFEGRSAPVLTDQEGFLECRKLTENSEELGYFASKSSSGDGVLIKTGPLTFGSSEHLPNTLAEFYAWLEQSDAAAKSRLDKFLGGSNSSNLLFSIFLLSPGGIVGARLKSNAVTPREAPVFTKLGASQFMQHPTLVIRDAQRLRGTAEPIEKIFARNSLTFEGIASKKIVLIGCGAVGGHLANLLIQNGAGSTKGHLLIVDPDRLSISNTLRHRLGVHHYGQFKSEAIYKELKKSFPLVNVDYVSGELDRAMVHLNDAEIIVDATGENAVREELNDWIISRRRSGTDPQLLQHCWIEGNGAAVFSFFNDAMNGACGRCVRSAYYADEPRYKTIIQPEEYDGVLCGGEVYAPYGPQAAVIAAGLAAQHLIESVNGVSPGSFRTMQIHLPNSRHTKPGSPKPLKDCPACRDSASD